MSENNASINCCCAWHCLDNAVTSKLACSNSSLLGVVVVELAARGFTGEEGEEDGRRPSVGSLPSSMTGLDRARRPGDECVEVVDVLLATDGWNVVVLALV